MAAAPFDHPWLSALLGDEEVSALFAAESDLAAMLRFEAALAQAEAEEGLVSSEAARAIRAAIAGFRPDMAGLRSGTAKDGMPVPELVRQLRAAVEATHGDAVHFGATSQDVLDTSLSLRLVEVLAIFARRLDAIDTALAALDARDGVRTVMAHTRMQAAIEVTAGRKIASWREPLARHRARLDEAGREVALVHFGGAAGTLEKLGDTGPAVLARLGRLLGLGVPERVRHSERDHLVALAGLFSIITGSLGKLGQDVALMAQSEVGEVRLSSVGGSSTMAHKRNPVAAETLVALARFNATLVSGMHQALVHENERSGAAWTLEWMLLPQMAVATGAALRTALALVQDIEFTDARHPGRPSGA